MRHWKRVASVVAGLVALFVLGLIPAAAPAADGPPQPTLASDKATYAPGDTVALSGANWTPNEVVRVHIADNGGNGWSRDVDVTAGADGSISDSFALPTAFPYQAAFADLAGRIAKLPP